MVMDGLTKRRVLQVATLRKLIFQGDIFGNVYAETVTISDDGTILSVSGDCNLIGWDVIPDCNRTLGAEPGLCCDVKGVEGDGTFRLSESSSLD